MNALRQFWGLAQLSLAVALRLRVAWLLLLAAFALAVGGAVLREFHFGSAEARFLTDYVCALFGSAGALVAALVGPALFQEGLRSGTTVVLLMHGARPGALVAAQVLAVVVLLGWLLVLCALALAVLMAWVGHPETITAGLHALARGAGGAVLLAAAGVCFATLARSAVLASTLTLALGVAGHLAPMISHAQAQASAGGHLLWMVLGWLVPDLSLFGVAPAGRAFVYAGAYAAVYVGLASWSMARREL